MQFYTYDPFDPWKAKRAGSDEAHGCAGSMRQHFITYGGRKEEVPGFRQRKTPAIAGVRDDADVCRGGERSRRIDEPSELHPMPVLR